MGKVERGMQAPANAVYLAFFTVVASCSNLSTFILGAKLVQGERKNKFYLCFSMLKLNFKLRSRLKLMQTRTKKSQCKTSALIYHTRFFRRTLTTPRFPTSACSSWRVRLLRFPCRVRGGRDRSSSSPRQPCRTTRGAHRQ